MCRKSIYIILALFALVGCDEKIELPASETLDLFDVEVGQPFPVKPFFSGEPKGSLPVFMFSVPLPDDTVIKTVKDFSVQIFKDTGLVTHVSFDRAFSSIDACRKEIESLSSLVKDRFKLQTDSYEYSTFKATAGDIEFDITCSVSEGSPYHDLRFVMSSKKQRLKFETQMKSLTRKSTGPRHFRAASLMLGRGPVT